MRFGFGLWMKEPLFTHTSELSGNSIRSHTFAPEPRLPDGWKLLTQEPSGKTDKSWNMESSARDSRPSRGAEVILNSSPNQSGVGCLEIAVASFSSCVAALRDLLMGIVLTKIWKSAQGCKLTHYFSAQCLKILTFFVIYNVTCTVYVRVCVINMMSMIRQWEKKEKFLR